MPVLRPLTVLADAARRALRIAARILGRIGAARRRRADEDRALAALAERFPDAPEHWLRFIAERAPALASAGETGALRMRDVAGAAALEPRRLPSPVGPRAVPDPVSRAGDSTAPAAGQRPRAPLLRLEPTRHDQIETPPVRPKARGLIRVLDPAGRRPGPAVVTGRPEPAPSPSTGTTEPSPPAHADETDEAREQPSQPERSRPFGGIRRLARRIAGGLRAAAMVLQRSRPGQPGRDADPQDKRHAAPSLYLVADGPSERDLDTASAAGHPATGRRSWSVPDRPGDRIRPVASQWPESRVGEIDPRPDRSARQDLTLVAAAPAVKATAEDGIAWPPFDRQVEEPVEGWTPLMPAGRQHPVEPNRARSRRVAPADPSLPDWPTLPWTEPARIGDAPVDPPRLDRLRQEQEVGLWSA
ncbi:MAG: hypothetical protein ACRC67_33835 [Inquilinus sp.]|uniref:hypothetical protein n=1 Tax=Inquilinus sp. TaxID=1932117 RepID=UPI003F37CC4D